MPSRTCYPLPHIVALVALLAIGCRSEPPQPVTEFREAQVNGTTLQYDVTGSGHPLVLIHGGFLDRRMWDEQVPVFANRFKVLRIDLRGFEGSPTPEDPFSYVDDLYGLLTQLDTGPVYLLGLSLGAMVATEFTTDHPEMVDALILAGAPLRGIQTEDPEGVQEKVIDVIRTFRRGALDSTVALVLELPFFRPGKENPEVRQKMAVMVQKNFGTWLHSMSLVRWDSVLASEKVGSINVPTLIIVGDRDVRSIQMASDSLSTRIPGAERVVIEGASHHMNMESPEAFNAAVLHFLEKLD